VYPKSVRIITLPNIDDIKKLSRGVKINNKIRNMDMLKHIHVFFVDFKNSIICVLTL